MPDFFLRVTPPAWGRRIARAALALLVLCTSSVLAQDKVALVHGFKSGPETWNAMSVDLAFRGYQVHRVSLQSNQALDSQATELLTELQGVGFNDPSTILVGHSQGGLISRVASRSTPFRALITIGTPHSGAPIANAQDKLDAYNWSAAHNIGLITTALQWINDADRPCDWECEEVDHLYAGWLAVWGYHFAATTISVAMSFQLSGNDALADLSPTSLFIAQAAARRGEELSGVAYALQGNISMGYMGGPMRLVMTGLEADQFGWEAYNFGSELIYVGGEYLWSYPWETPDGFWELLLGSAMIDLGFQITDIGPWWTYEIVGGFPNDAIVPYARQALANAVMIPVLGITHTEETSHPNSRQQIISLIDNLTGR